MKALLPFNITDKPVACFHLNKQLFINADMTSPYIVVTVISEYLPLIIQKFPARKPELPTRITSLYSYITLTNFYVCLTEINRCFIKRFTWTIHNVIAPATLKQSRYIIVWSSGECHWSPPPSPSLRLL